ncbi:LysE family translocator [Variovorax sp. J22R133]|uniref:LysE family translocator n=1 Tax=Variovorax brevis TaxID=3053503 RepID=UPI002575D874|nr:LysE family translocator [Variovorax sp. J22R133]MDM0112117.1 LysE family translocator [Variovorax sp. J22R133]
MTFDTLFLFVVSSILLAITPGPTMLLALSNGISGGMRRAGWGIAGASLGSVTVITAVALGLGSLMAASEVLFNALRVAGVLYLVWLGVKMWRSPPPDVAAAIAQQDESPQGGKALMRSLAVALSNPKSVLFFAAFLPQFIDTTLPQVHQYIVLGGIFVALDTCVMLAYASAGTQAVRWMSRRSLQRLNHGCAAGMWALAAMLAFWRRPGA